MEKSAKYQKSKEKSKPKVKSNRKLNVVYFIDSEKTKSFTMSLSRLNLIFAGLGLVVLWSVASSGLVYYLASDNIVVQKRYQKALTVIFDFQSRYQGVYDKAYPDHSNSPAPIAQVVKPVAVAQSKPTVKKIVPTAQVRPEIIKKAQKTAKPKAAMIAKKPESQAWSLELLKPKVVKKAKGFELSFAIRNGSHSKKKAQGYVWAIAKFIKSSGETLYLSAPPYIKVNKKGGVINAKRSHKYSIRNYKQKNFSFLAPAGLSGRLVSMDIGLMTQQGKTRVKTYPQNIRFTYEASKSAVDSGKTAPGAGPASQAAGNSSNKVNKANKVNKNKTGASINGSLGTVPNEGSGRDIGLPPLPRQTISSRSKEEGRGENQDSTLE